MNYHNIKTLQYVTNCTRISERQYDRLFEGARKANKKEVNRLVRLHLPELYNELALHLYNPYNYHRTVTHLILSHSSIDYFLKFNYQPVII